MTAPRQPDAPRPSALRGLVTSARPTHWVKNAVVLLPVIFGLRMEEPWAWARAAVAAAAFCLAASAAYLLNDLCDRSYDRHHPLKARRPIASGAVGPGAAGGAAALLAVAALAVAGTVGWPVAALAAGYLALAAAYSLGLKHKMLLDVMAVAGGFVLRAAAGAAAIPVRVSPWLVVCTFTGCLFLGFCKRYNELATLGGASGEPGRHRPTLDGYTPVLLTHLVTLSAAVAILSFLLYATSPMTVANFHTVGLVYTVPLVIYGVCRVAMLSMMGRYTDPTDIMLRDRPFQLTVVLWTALAAVIVKWGQAIPAWLGGGM